MLSFTHTLISLPFGYYFEHPLLAFIAAFVFHLFADTLLHWNLYHHHRPFFLFVAIDVTSGLIAAAAITGSSLYTPTVLAAILGGNMPDIIHTLWDLAGARTRHPLLAWAKPFFTFHQRLQWETLSISKGLASQIILIVLSWFLITYHL